MESANNGNDTYKAILLSGDKPSTHARTADWHGKASSMHCWVKQRSAGQCA